MRARWALLLMFLLSGSVAAAAPDWDSPPLSAGDEVTQTVVSVTDKGRLIVLGLAAVVVVVVVSLHYEALQLLAKLSRVLARWPRLSMSLLITGLLLAHLVEIVIFGLVYALIDGRPGLGEVAAHQGVSSGFDYIYFSGVTYTTLGFGDLVPRGALRLLAPIEALAGLLLITWSASFTYLQMRNAHSLQPPKADERSGAPGPRDR